MKLFSASTLSLAIASAVLLTGCATSDSSPPPATPAKPSASAAKPAAAPSTAPVAGPTTAAALPPIAVEEAAPAPAVQSPEVTEMVAHLTQSGQSDALPHEIADTTGFPEAMASLAPGARAPKISYFDSSSQPPPKGLTADGNSTALIEHDWTGLVLVPISTSLSKAYTTAVRLLKVEAHPLRDGRVRIWIRVQNVGQKALASEIACAFRMQGETGAVSPYFYELEVPTRAYRDVFFVSPEGKLNTYTVLVRPSRAN